MRLIPLLLLSCVAAAAPQRVVSTAPSFTETVFALGAGGRLVAVSTYCHYPAEANRLPRIGSYLKPNIEAIARLRPDLVIVHAEQRQSVAQLHSLGIATLQVRNTTLEETLASARSIGAALGVADRGVELEKSIRSKLAAIESASKGKPPRSMLFVVGRTPGRLEGIVAVGKGSFLNELIRIAGGRNVLADSPVAYPSISLEAILRLDPDVIVDMGEMAETTGVTPERIKGVAALWSAQQGIRAVRTSRLFPVAADIYVVPGPRVVEAAESFARMLQAGPAQ